MNDDLMYSLD